MKFLALVFTTFAALTALVSSEILERCPTKKSVVNYSFQNRTRVFKKNKEIIMKCRDEFPNWLEYNVCLDSKNVMVENSIGPKLKLLANEEIQDKEKFEKAINEILGDLCKTIEEEYSNFSEDLDENGEYKGKNAGGIVFGLIIFVAIVGGLIWYFNKSNHDNNSVPMPQQPGYGQQPQYVQPPYPYYVPNAPSPYSIPRNPSPYLQQYQMSPLQQPYIL